MRGFKVRVTKSRDTSVSGDCEFEATAAVSAESVMECLLLFILSIELLKLTSVF